MPSIKQLEGKAFTLKLEGKQRTIGKVTDARIDKSRTQVQVTITLTDEEAAGLLGAAQDKFEAAESEIGMSDREITEALWAHQDAL